MNDTKVFAVNDRFRRIFVTLFNSLTVNRMILLVFFWESFCDVQDKDLVLINHGLIYRPNFVISCRFLDAKKVCKDVPSSRKDDDKSFCFEQEMFNILNASFEIQKIKVSNQA